MENMTVAAHTVSFMLRNSGDVLAEVELGDVLLERRDGSNVVMSTVRREQAVRDGLDMAARALGSVLRDPALGARAVAALEDALPWVGWLNVEDRGEFGEAFVRTSRACHDTSNYEPLVRLLHRWKVSAQIVNDPELAALLSRADETDAPVPLTRPAG
jgi:hypothetical protein